jgi:hypothetical protein
MIRCPGGPIAAGRPLYRVVLNIHATERHLPAVDEQPTPQRTRSPDDPAVDGLPALDGQVLHHQCEVRSRSPNLKIVGGTDGFEDDAQPLTDHCQLRSRGGLNELIGDKVNPRRHVDSVTRVAIAIRRGDGRAQLQRTGHIEHGWNSAVFKTFDRIRENARWPFPLPRPAAGREKLVQNGVPGPLGNARIGRHHSPPVEFSGTADPVSFGIHPS